MTGAWLLTNDSKQISDCTGGRISDAVRYSQSERNKIMVTMNQQENLAVYFAEMLAKQNATPEEKKIQALFKTALYGDNLITFIDEVSKAFNGCRKVKVDTVKGVTEYFKPSSEAQIRKGNCSEEERAISQ